MTAARDHAAAPGLAMPRVAIVGGGLAGLAAAVALSTSGCQVELFEARRALGGRASSFRDPASGELVDHCQHVSMGCCTNLADFCRRTGTSELLERERVLTFIGPDGRASRMAAVNWLPAPLHLGPALFAASYLTVRDKIGISRALWKLMRDKRGAVLFGAWLREQGQSAEAIARFWEVILVSALGEELERVSYEAARKVLVDGFMASREAYVMEVPRVPLGQLYGAALTRWLAERGVALRLETPVRQVAWSNGPTVITTDGQFMPADYVVVAAPWNRIAQIVDPPLTVEWAWLDELSQLEASPITGVHLWFDRPIMPLKHAVLVGRLSQWVFRREGDGNLLQDSGREDKSKPGAARPLTPGPSPARGEGSEIGEGPGVRGRSEGSSEESVYYQVIISASRSLAGREREAVVQDVCRELAEIWPQAREAKLLRSRVVTEHGAVFSPRPDVERLRPAQQTNHPWLLLAGDWTATGWPATMESAVRSGYLAAEAIMKSLGREQAFLAPDLPRGWLARLLIA